MRPSRSSYSLAISCAVDFISSNSGLTMPSDHTRKFVPSAWKCSLPLKRRVLRSFATFKNSLAVLGAAVISIAESAEVFSGLPNNRPLVSVK